MAASVGFSAVGTRGSPHTQALDQRLGRVPSPTPNISDTQADLSPSSTDEFLQCGRPKILPRSEDAVLVACLDNDNLPETAQAVGCQVLSGGDEEEGEEEEADDAKNGLSIYQKYDDENHVELWPFDRAPGSSNDMNGYKLRNIAADALQVACSEVPPEDAVALAKQHLSLRDDRTTDDRTTISTPPSLNDALGMSRSHSVDLPDNHSMSLPDDYYTDIPDDYCMDIPNDFCTNMPDSYPTNMPNYCSVDIENSYSVAIPNNYSIDLPDTHSMAIPNNYSIDLPDTHSMAIPNNYSMDLPDTCSVGIREKAKLPPMRDGSDKLESSGQYLPSIHEVVCASGYNTRFETPTATSLATISQPGSEALVTRAPGRPLRPKPPRSKSPVSTSACSHEASPRGLPSPMREFDAANPSGGPYICSFEGCTAPPFQSLYLLNSHSNVHSSLRPYHCPVPNCPRSQDGIGFKRKNELLRHGLVHISPGYICPFCSCSKRKYPRRDNLLRHVNSHHAGKSKDDPLLQQAFAHHEG